MLVMEDGTRYIGGGGLQACADGTSTKKILVYHHEFHCVRALRSKCRT